MKKSVKIYSRKSLPAMVKPSYYKTVTMREFNKWLKVFMKENAGVLDELAKL